MVARRRERRRRKGVNRPIVKTKLKIVVMVDGRKGRGGVERKQQLPTKKTSFRTD